jgi:hypothetical protein
MATKKKHVAWDFYKDYHKGGKCGCIWRHASGFGKTPCHYAINGFRISGSRRGLYNKDHRANAIAAGHAVMRDGEFMPAGARVKKEVAGEAAKRRAGKAAKSFIRKFEGRFFGAMHYLQLHKDGWHYGYTLAADQVPKSRKEHGRQKTFAIFEKKGSGGYGAWYPYFHNYHHLVPQGALHEMVIANDTESEKRVEIICASKWNINKRKNIILLPEEESISLMVELPAHTPWSERSHTAYSDSMKQVLKGVKTSLDANIAKGNCEVAEADVSQQLDEAIETAYGQVPSMAAGRQLGRVALP